MKKDISTLTSYFGRSFWTSAWKRDCLTIDLDDLRNTVRDGAHNNWMNYRYGTLANQPIETSHSNNRPQNVPGKKGENWNEFW